MNFTTDQREALNDEYSKLVHRNEQLENDLITLGELYDNLMEQFEDLQRKYNELKNNGLSLPSIESSIFEDLQNKYDELKKEKQNRISHDFK